MSYTVNTNTLDQPISGVEMKLPIPAVNFDANFRMTKNDPRELIVTNLTSPLGLAEKFRWSFSDVANVYSGTDISPALRSQLSQGVSVLCQLTENWTVTSSEDPSYEVVLPVSAHVVLKLPVNNAISGDNILTLVERLISGIMPKGEIGSERLAALVRGSLSPFSNLNS